MTRTELEKVYYLKKELVMWQERLAELQADIALGTKIIDGMPRTSTNGKTDPTESKAIKLTEVSKIIEGKISEIQYAISEVEEYILTIEDPLTRLIIELRCCLLYSWERVADIVGGNNTAESVRQLYHRFIKDLPK